MYLPHLFGDVERFGRTVQPIPGIRSGESLVTHHLLGLEVPDRLEGRGQAFLGDQVPDRLDLVGLGDVDFTAQFLEMDEIATTPAAGLLQRRCRLGLHDLSPHARPRGADADARPGPPLVELGRKVLGQRYGGLVLRARHQQREVVVAQPVGQVRKALFLQDLGHFDELPVSGLSALFVVGGPEVINIEHDQRIDVSDAL